MYILSLPIPEAEFNYFSIVVVPMTASVIRKVIFKLHRTATVVRLYVYREITLMHLRKRQERMQRITIFVRLITIT